MIRLKILIVDDERPARFGLVKALTHADYELGEAADGRAAVEAIRGGGWDLVFLDLNMPTLDGLGVLRELNAAAALPEIIVVTAHESVQTAVECLRAGAADYLTKPYEVAQLRAIAARAHKRRQLEYQVAELQHQLENQQRCGAMLGASRAMRDLFALVTRAAAAPVDVLICGETGTGKELIAREIHRLSPRAKGPFVAVNTAAIAESLAESELFGHVRGAFTGADRDRIGVFQQAHGGTLFLDEIGDMPLASQAKILRVLQERVVQPVGATQTTPVNVRVVSATHQDLSAAVEAGHFRRDLFYRIKGLELRVAPLRQRREDILLLAECFLERHAERTGQPAPSFSSDAIDRMLAYPWPGNVRELEHAIVAAATLATGPTIRPTDLPLSPATAANNDLNFTALFGLPLSEAKAQLIETFERAAIQAALDAQQGNISAAARVLGIHRQSLQQKLHQLGISRPSTP